MFNTRLNFVTKIAVQNAQSPCAVSGFPPEATILGSLFNECNSHIRIFYSCFISYNDNLSLCLIFSFQSTNFVVCSRMNVPLPRMG